MEPIVSQCDSKVAETNQHDFYYIKTPVKIIRIDEKIMKFSEETQALSYITSCCPDGFTSQDLIKHGWRIKYCDMK